MQEIIFGFLSGNITSLGRSGGTVLILLLSLIMGVEQHIAQATNLIFFVPTSISSIIINLKNKNVDLNTAIMVSIFGIVGAIIGVNISQNINSIYLKKIFALFILFIAIYELYKFFKGYKREEKTHNNYKK